MSNRDFVAGVSGGDRNSWTFRIRAEATTTEGLEAELLAACETLFEAPPRLFRAASYDLRMQTAGGDARPSGGHGERVVESGKLDATGDSLVEVMRSLETHRSDPASDDRYLCGVLADAAVRVWTPSFDDYVCAGDERFRSARAHRVEPADSSRDDLWHSAGPPLDFSPATVDVSLVHRDTPDPADSQVSSEDVYIEVSIRTSVQIWFEDSAVGYRNRQRLVELFDALYESFDVVDGRFGGDGSATVNVETTPYLQPLAPWTGGPSIDDTRSRYPTLAYYEAEAPGPDHPRFPGVDAFRAYLFHDRDFERLPYYEIPSYGDRHDLFEVIIRELFESDADVDPVVAAISSATGSSKHPGVVDHVLKVLTEYPDARAIDAVAPLVHTGSEDQKRLAREYLIANLHDGQARAFVESVADGAADFETAESIAQDALVDLE